MLVGGGRGRLCRAMKLDRDGDSHRIFCEADAQMLAPGSSVPRKPEEEKKTQRRQTAKRTALPSKDKLIFVPSSPVPDSQPLQFLLLPPLFSLN